VTGVVTSRKLDGDNGFAARAFLRSEGLTATQVRQRPVIGICNSWSELNPCNTPLRDLSEAVKRGVIEAGGLPLEFPTISLSEAFVHPTTMMLRNLMAMDVEEMITSSPIDGVVLLNGCDKTVAAQMMGALSANKPALLLGSGYRPVGNWEGQAVTIDDSWRLGDDHRAGTISDAAWEELEGCLNPGPGVCNVLGTAVTLAMIAEALGFALPGSALEPANSAERVALAEETGRQAVTTATENRRPREAVTRQALLDAWRLVCAVGGSTNAIIHLAALAGRAGVEIGWQEFREVGRSTPTLARVKPSGPFDLSDLHAEGGVPALVRELTDQWGVDRPTAGGATWAATIESTPVSASRALASRADPVDPSGAISLLRGSLAPDGAVIKKSAGSSELLTHIGPAVVFNGLADFRARVHDPDLAVTAESVLVLRNVGPVGGLGMPEVTLSIPDKLYREGVRDMARITDGRMSGTSRGTIVLHVAPEAAVGGPLGLVEDGDLIELDVEGGRLELLVDDTELARRAGVGQRPFTPPAAPVRGYRRLYAMHVTQANRGCDFDFLRAELAPGTAPAAINVRHIQEVK
jgi:dihydroxy-acid dehydratase